MVATLAAISRLGTRGLAVKSAQMNYVTGGHHHALRAGFQTQPALVVDGTRGPDEFLAARQLGAHARADGQAAGTVVGRELVGPGAARPGDEAPAERSQHANDQLAAIGCGDSEVEQRGRPATVDLFWRLSYVEPQANYHNRLSDLGKNPGQLAAPGQYVVRPLETHLNAGRLEQGGHRVDHRHTGGQ